LHSALQISFARGPPNDEFAGFDWHADEKGFCTKGRYSIQNKKKTSNMHVFRADTKVFKL